MTGRGPHTIARSALIALLASALLAACASHPPTRSGRTTTRAGISGGGGYYQNDGPPADTNIDLSKIPNAVPKNVPLSKFGNPTSYTALGKRYYVLKSAAGFTQTGLASWYGRQFAGERTSSGVPYNMFAMTAAHKRLPIPSWVRVTNLENGRHVIVKINDRGPFHPGRIIDLSYVAARKLGIVVDGSARVRIRTVTPSDYRDTAAELADASQAPQAPLRAAVNPPTDADTRASTSTASSSTLATSDSGSRVAMAAASSDRTSLRSHATPAAPRSPQSVAAGGMLQIGAFSEHPNAERLEHEVVAAGFGPVEILPPTSQLALYRVRLGPFANAATCDAVARRLAAQGYSVRHVKR